MNSTTILKEKKSYKDKSEKH